MTTLTAQNTRHIAIAHMALSIALVAFGAIIGG
jgi:hypothetical protein